MKADPITILRRGDSTAQIDAQGAWLADLTLNGNKVFYTRQNVTYPDGAVKQRGGCHVCLPNFGPGGDADLPQHGYGRLEKWQIEEVAPTQVALTHDGGPGVYAVLKSRLVYELLDGGLRMTLELRNDGPTPLRVAPGFHPYFASQTSVTELRVDDATYDVATLGEAQFIAKRGGRILIGDRSCHLESPSLPQWALWTDNPDAYVCVEPTHAGFAFMENGATLLPPNETREWSLAIRQ